MKVTAQDQPRYDGWGPDQPWSCVEWLEWHRALAALFCLDRADDVWAAAWLAGLSRLGGGRGTARGSGLIFDAVPVECRTFNSDFLAYVASRPKLRAAVWAGVGGALAAPISGLASLARGAGFGLQATGAVLERTAEEIRSASSPAVWVSLAALALLYLKPKRR